LADLFEKDPNAEAAAGAKLDDIALSAEQLTTVVERMGQLVLGVKALFDSRCASKTEEVPAYDIPGMLLDLGLGADAFTKARTYLTEAHIESMSFPKFLELYAGHSGLTAASYSKISLKEGVVPYWVPNSDGMWVEASLHHIANEVFLLNLMHLLLWFCCTLGGGRCDAEGAPRSRTLLAVGSGGACADTHFGVPAAPSAACTAALGRRDRQCVAEG
jgi:hypothetical protein